MTGRFSYTAPPDMTFGTRRRVATRYHRSPPVHGCPCSSGDVAQNGLIRDCSLSRLSSADGLAKGLEAVHDGDADLDFGGLAVGVSRHDPFAEKLQAVHQSLDPTSDVVAYPLSSRALAPVAGSSAGSRFARWRRYSLLFRHGHCAGLV